MKSLNTQLTTKFNNLFDINRTSVIDGSNLLETTLRYISVLTAGEKVFESDYQHLKYTEASAYWASVQDIARENSIMVITDCDNRYWGEGSSFQTYFVDSPDFVELNDNFCPVNQFLSSKPQFSRVFVNNSLKSAVITTSSATPSTRWFIKMLSVLPRVLQWIFTTEELRTDKYFKSLLDEDFDGIINAVNETCSKIDFRKIQLTKLLAGYEDYYVTEQIQNLKHTNEAFYNDIRECERKIANYLSIKAQNNIQIQALQNSLKNGDNAVLNFFMQRPCLTIIKREGGRLFYSVTETLEYYDEEEYARSMPNYITRLQDKHQANYKKLLDSIFIDKKGAFRVKSDFVFNYTSSLQPKKKDEVVGSMYFDILPHPHLANFACLGANAAAIDKYLEEGDWDMAIDQTIGATKNINFGDSAVVGRFLDFLECNPKTKMIEYGDQYLSPSEYYKIVFGGELYEQEN